MGFVLILIELQFMDT